MVLRICAAALLACIFAMSPVLAQAPAGSTTINGRILETSAGLPVAGAAVELRQGVNVIAKTTTNADGSFSFSGVGPGTYQISITAARYQSAVIPALAIEPGQPSVDVQTALVPGVTGLRQIAVVSSTRGALQTTATVNSNLNPQVITDQNYARAGDALATLPFVTASTSSALGDDLSISLRGFDSSESATLLDGHPIGPTGAHGNAYDYQLAQFWGFANTGVIYGSGATGLYAVPVLAGAVNFETINPTQQPHSSFTQGVGDLGHLLSGIQVTDTIGHVGYALAYGVDGTNGMLTGNILQSNLAAGGQSRCPNNPSWQVYAPLINASTGPLSGGSLPPSIASGDLASCNYNVTGDYLNRNFVGKVVGQITPRTTLTATVYNASMYADSTGNGDTDYEPYQVQLASAQGAVSGGPVNYTLANGNSTACTGATLAVLSNPLPNAYQCLTPQQYAQDFYGPSGGGLGRYHAAQNQDYDLRLTQGIGPGDLILDGYIDNYTFVNQKGPLNAYIQAASYLDDYFTHGGVVRYEYAKGKNDLAVGFTALHQLFQGNDTAGYPITPIGASAPILVSFGPFTESDTIAQNSYFLHDTWTPNGRFSAFADLNIERSFTTATTNLNPRLSLVYRATSNDVWRVSAGRATSDPDPSLVTGGISFNPPVASDPSFNPANTCGTSGLVSLGGGSSTLVKPESANDIELALAHRFQNQATFEVDAYDTTEQNPIISGVFPISTVPAGQVPSASYFQEYANVLNTTCGVSSYNVNSFGVSIPFNSGKAIYKGINLDTKIPIVRGLEVDGNYAMQSAQFQDLQDQILFTNGGLLNGYQMYGVPVNSANAGIGYSSVAGGWTARFDEHFVSENNGFNRPSYWYATANASKTIGPVTFNLGVFNLFNQNSQQFGYIGLGTQGYFNAFNPPDTTNAFNNNNEMYGLPVRQFWLTTTVRF
jgi:outer membrane receptor for ferrienterochelin and colicin